MRRTPGISAFALLLTLGVSVFFAVPANSPFALPVAAQGSPLDTLNETLNDTAPSDTGEARYENVIIVAYPRESFLQIEARPTGSATFNIDVIDYSLPGAVATKASPVRVVCEPVNTTSIEETKGTWSVTRGAAANVRRNAADDTSIIVSTLPFPKPEYFHMEVSCTAASLLGREVGHFNLTARVLPYTYLTLMPVDVPDRVSPNQVVEYSVRLKNNGNHANTFYGQVEAPPGWTVTYPEQVVLQAGEERELTMKVWTPRDQLVYLSESALIRISYYPEGSPAKLVTVNAPFQMTGVYLHPALVPLTVLTLLVLGMLIFFALIGRRHVEEQILGKPVPPWRIPEERAMLRTLMREDPDQYYIVRYYLMVEEHQSALLWFHAFKEATKKDRHRERKWIKVKRKQENKVAALERAHNKLVAGSERDLGKPERKAERKVRRLERKLRRKDKKKGRKLERKHRKKVKKIEKKYDKKVHKVTKKYEKKRGRELRKVEKQNRKRIKRGEPELPLPEMPPPEVPALELPPAPVLEEKALEESRYAKRAERKRTRAVTQRERLSAKVQKRIAKDRVRTDIKQEKLLSKIPPEPTTHLYDTDEYVPEGQVIVESDRSTLAKALHLPTLQQREEDRRRRQVFQAKIKAARAEGDAAKAEELQADFDSYRKSRQERRRAVALANEGSKREAARLEKERQRRLKERARALAGEAGIVGKEPTGGGAIPVKERAPAAVAMESSQEPRGLRARFGRKARTEAEKKEATPSVADTER